MSKPRSNPLGYTLLALLIILLDQGFKFVATSYFGIVKNPGIVLGLFTPLTFYLVALGIGFLALLLLKTPLSSSSSLLIGGAVSNLIDRLRFGYVVDYIDISKIIPGEKLTFPVFNLADLAIVIGALLLLREILPTKGSKYGRENLGS